MQDTIRDLRKHKVQLSDYDYQSDIQNRIILSRLTPEALAVLEEILCSSISFSIKSLCDNLDMDRIELDSLLEELLPTQLFVSDGTMIHVDKEKRKYYETHIEKFNEDFRPDMDYLQSLLKHIPIQVLPIWYQIPRTSNNIFASLIEKCSLTPAIFQRYYHDFISGEDVQSQIVKDVYESKDLYLPAEEVKEKYHFSEETYQELVLFLELNLLCVSSFKKVNNGFIEILSPFQEWCNYINHLKTSKPLSLPPKEILIYRKNEFAFIEDMTSLLNISKVQSLEVTFLAFSDEWVISPLSFHSIKNLLESPSEVYVNRLINKLLILGLGLIEDTFLKPTDIAEDFIKTPIEKRAHITFKHPHHFLSLEKQSRLSSQRAVLEIEKNIATISNLDWITFDSFLKGSIIALSEEDRITLKRVGGEWDYQFPDYDSDAKNFIKYVVMDWLFECGMVQIGTHRDSPCFRVTSLGRSLFVN